MSRRPRRSRTVRQADPDEGHRRPTRCSISLAAQTHLPTTDGASGRASHSRCDNRGPHRQLLYAHTTLGPRNWVTSSSAIDWMRTSISSRIHPSRVSQVGMDKGGVSGRMFLHGDPPSHRAHHPASISREVQGRLLSFSTPFECSSSSTFLRALWRGRADIIRAL